MYGQPVGSINLTSTSATEYLIESINQTIGVMYSPFTRIFNIELISGSTASVLTVSNGSGGTVFIKVTGIANQGANFDFGIAGHTFPLGAYITLDGNQTSATLAGAAEYTGKDNTAYVSVYDDTSTLVYDDANNIIYA
jgi:hypothetical protein